jgi:hypothetical protein
MGKQTFFIYLTAVIEIDIGGSAEFCNNPLWLSETERIQRLAGKSFRRRKAGYNESAPSPV